MSALACPRCPGSKLVVGRRERFSVVTCPTCAGTWLDSYTARSVLAPLNAEPRTRDAGIPCPVCEVELGVVVAAGIEVDRCISDGAGHLVTAAEASLDLVGSIFEAMTDALG